MMRRYIKGASALAMMAVCGVAVPASSATVDERLSQLAAEHLGVDKKETKRADVDAISDDVAVRSGDWLMLAGKYEMEFVSGDVNNAPTPQVLASWWDQMGDSTLSDLIFMALNRNRTLASARAKVVEARAALGISRSSLLPWFDASGSWSASDPSENGAQASAGYSELSRIGIDASWEIDIFGGRRAAVEASAADLASAHASLHAAWVSLSSEVAVNYISLCTLRARLNIANEDLRLQSETLDMLQSKYDSGLADALALSQAKYTYEQTKATIPPIRSSIEQVTNALSILVGEVPGKLKEVLDRQQPIPSPNAVEVVGIPAEAVRRRPDIRAAEMAFVAQTARTRSARADLYPKFRLIGSIGLEAFSGASLFSGDSYGASITPSFTWPIFHAGAIRRNIKVQTAREEALLAAYEGTVLKAVAEVRDALTSYEQELVRNSSLKQGIESARTALEIAQDQYRNGLIDFNNVISAQTALLAFQDQEVVSRGSIASDVVALFKALGGGWQPLVDEEIEAAKD